LTSAVICSPVRRSGSSISRGSLTTIPTSVIPAAAIASSP